MNDASQAEYDATLKAFVASDAARSAQYSDNTSKEKTDNATAAVPVARKRPSQWKYHAASAAVLLSVVALIVWLNRGEGGRRAARTAATATGRAWIASDAVSDVADDSTANDSRNAGDAKPQRPLRSPISKPRKTGSGLGAGLSGKFGDVLSDIADQSKSYNTGQTTSNGFQPQRGLLIGPIKTGNKAVRPPGKLVTVGGFPGQVNENFRCDAGFAWFVVKDQQLRVKPDAGGETPRMRALKSPSMRLAHHGALSVRTSVAKGMPGTVRVAFSIDGVLIGIRPAKNSLEVFARDRGDETAIESISKLDSVGKPTTLTIGRDAKESDVLHWYVQSGKQKQSGTITATNLPSSAEVCLVITPSKKKTKPPLWVNDLRISNP